MLSYLKTRAKALKVVASGQPFTMAYCSQTGGGELSSFTPRDSLILCQFAAGIALEQTRHAQEVVDNRLEVLNNLYDQFERAAGGPAPVDGDVFPPDEAPVATTSPDPLPAPAGMVITDPGAVA